MDLPYAVAPAAVAAERSRVAAASLTYVRGFDRLLNGKRT